MWTRRRFLTALGLMAAYPFTSGFITPGALPDPGESENSTPGRVTVMAVGDVMMHAMNIKHACDPKTGRYDFFPYFEFVKPVFDQADWVIGNLETKLAGPKAKYTGYPMFNAPEQLAMDLKKTGFTFLSTANNHCLDRRPEGVRRTNEMLDWAGIKHTGTFLSPEDHDTVRILRKNGISLALLAYTYGTNGIPIPEGHEYLVNLIEMDRIEKDVARAKALEVDFIACAIHFGVEYARVPDNIQKDTVQKLFDLGVDVVLGSHPHVVQPYQVIEQNGAKKAVIYSMGNFVGNQKGLYTNIGAIFKFELVKTPDGKKDLAGVEAMPTRILRVTREQRGSFQVMPMKWALDNKETSGLSDSLLAELEQQLNGMDKHLRSMMG